MKRAIVTPPPLSPAALAELKQWLGISTAQDDAPLTALLRAGLDICEAFTGAMPIEALCEEVLPLTGEWQALSTRPVQAIVDVQGIAASGTRTSLAVIDYAVELDARWQRAGASYAAGRCHAARGALYRRLRRAGKHCPRRCATACFGSPPISTASVRPAAPGHSRPLPSLRCGVHGGGCG